MMRRLMIALGAMAAAHPVAIYAQSGKVWRIGMLETVSPDKNAANMEALRQSLRERGYVEGTNLVIEYRTAEGHAERFPELASQLVASGCDLIVTRGTPAARAAKDATKTIPIVMAAIGEPLGVGVVASLAHPGGNVTGLSAYVTELAGKRVELLQRTFPSLRRIAFMQDMGNPVAPPQWEATRKAADEMGLASELIDVRNEEQIRQGFGSLADKHIDGVSVGIDVLTQAHVATIVQLAAAYRVITAYPSREFADAGGLLSYGPSYPDLYRRAGGMIDKILKGAKVGDIPVEQPIKLELVVNLRTAKVLGVVVPSQILTAANEVLE
jgi:putative ABC transport system substrate-binding protein